MTLNEHPSTTRSGRHHGPAGHRSDDDFAEALIAVHRRPLHTYVRKLLLGDLQRTEEVVQETILRAWQHRYDIGERTLEAWMFRVARNQVFDLLRRQSLRPMEPLETQTLDLPDPRVEDEFESVLQDRILVSMLSRLSMTHREVLLQLYLVGRSQSETAEALGVAQGTVKSRTHYAINQLRKFHGLQ